MAGSKETAGPTKKPRAGLIFLHGSGDSGKNFEAWLQDVSRGAFLRRLTEARVAVVFPSAKAVPYTLNGGKPQAVWFDRSRMAYEAPEDRPGIARSLAQVDALIAALAAKGIPLRRIGVAGMSMGGCLALHAAYGRGRYAGKLLGCASLSTFLPENSELDALAKDLSGPPLFMAHGEEDGMVNPAWAQRTCKRLQAVGIPVPQGVVTYEALDHDISEEEINSVVDFFINCLAASGGEERECSCFQGCRSM
eukprot:TRINITY_DN11674_c0_g1_i1.p1 TRINITY_DN11674_c0_g1~~TRINITY_DN11674_c0_g1_i1.p1  ORF type:complete len:250 (-),score=40.17 TRINITY_DN11674_c0_g1_i1:89-838(-)